MNNLKITQLVLNGSKYKTPILTTLFGWIPSLPGLGLRYLFYPLIFKKMGRSVKIYPDVRLKNAQNIEIGFGVVLHQGVEIDLNSENELKICDRVNLARDVCLILAGAKSNIHLANLVSLGRGVHLTVFDTGQISINEGTYIGPYTCISAYGKLKIGKNCLIASHCSIYAHNHNFSDPDKLIAKQGFNFKGVTIEDDCWLGSGVRVVDGVTIGKGSVIAAGSVVMKDIPPYSIAAGVPTKIVAKREAKELSVV
jgi:acetyltransferase-like isoleucine patch superfamily enzyme